MRNAEYDRMLLETLEELTQRNFNVALSGKELYVFLKDHNEECTACSFWIQAEKIMPAAMRGVKIYYMLYYSRRYFDPVGDINLYKIAQILSTVQLKDLSAVTANIIEQFSDFHPHSVRLAVQKIITVKNKKRKSWPDLLEEYKERAQNFSLKDYEAERLIERQYYNIENSNDAEQEKQQSAASSGAKSALPAEQASSSSRLSEGYSDYTDYYSISADSEFDQLNQPTAIEQEEQFSQKLFEIVKYRAKQLKGNKFPTDFQILIYYDTHKAFFESLWADLNISCPAIKHIRNYFENVLLLKLSPELNAEQRSYMKSHYRYYKLLKGEKLRAYCEKTMESELFKGKQVFIKVLNYMESNETRDEQPEKPNTAQNTENTTIEQVDVQEVANEIKQTPENIETLQQAAKEGIEYIDLKTKGLCLSSQMSVDYAQLIKIAAKIKK